MTLQAIVAALGGDLYDGGRRASVPAPGHSRLDRSVSLLADGDRLVVHGFGATDWRTVRDHLIALGLLDRTGRLMAGTGLANGPSPVRPDAAVRIAAARRLWEDSDPIGPASLSRRHLDLRAIRRDPMTIPGLRHHSGAPLAVYRDAGARRPALVAAITGPDGDLTAVEILYLSPSGGRDDRVRTSRKTIGLVPSGAAVRLSPSGPEMVVGEGVMTVLSAGESLGLPGWAALSAHNLAAWTPPAGTGRVVIAADRGAAGLTAADQLARRLRGLGVRTLVRPPPGVAEDWNAWAMARRREEGG